MRPGLLRRPRRALLRTRVLIGVLLVTLVALAAFDVAAVTALRTYLIGQTDSQLQNLIGLYRLANSIPRNSQLEGVGLSRPPRATPPANWISSPPDAKFPAQEQLHAPFLQPFSVELVTGKYVKGVSPSLTIKGIVVVGGGLAPRLLPQKNLSGLAARGQAWTTTSLRGNEQLRLLARPAPERSVIVAYTSLDGVNKTVGQLELILVIGSAAAGLLAAGGVAWIMRRGLRPIETMAGQADAITAGDLNSRVGPQDPRTEVGRLGVALNGMLARIEDFISEREASQEATRRFFADASHELRTPLASLRANAELYQQGALPRGDQVDEAMRRIALEAKRMGGLVDDMLRLARLDQRPERHHDWVDLTGLIGECAERARTAHPGHAWQPCVAPGLATFGDEELLRQAVDNLLANVAAHTGDGSTATITADLCGDNVAVEVSDDGPGVAEDQLPRIFDRFHRAGAPSARSGSGLGLAIVAATAAAHYGDVEATLNHPHGLCVALTLPAAGPPPTENLLPSHPEDASLRRG
jgi:two-component system OmpR family sensor kinase